MKDNLDFISTLIAVIKSMGITGLYAVSLTATS